MKPRNPFYPLFAVGLCLYLAVANHRGWSLVQTFVPAALRPGAPLTQHK
jgi:hypothetical protein